MLHALPVRTTLTAAAPRSPMTEKRARIPLPACRTPPFEHDYLPASPSRSRTRFRTVDGAVFEVYDASVIASGAMTKAIHRTRFNARSSSTPFQSDTTPHLLANVNADVLETVLRYCYFHASQMCSSMTPHEIKTWDNQFAALDPDQLCDLASAAYYLDIKDLVDLTCRAIAALISGKSAEQIRKTFHIENDLASTIDRVLPRVLPRDFYLRGPIRSAKDASSRLLNMDRHLRKDARARAKSAPNALANDRPASDAAMTNIPPAITDRSVDELTEWICSGEPSKNSGKRRKNKKKQKSAARRSDSDVTEQVLVASKETFSDGPPSAESLSKSEPDSDSKIESSVSEEPPPTYSKIHDNEIRECAVSPKERKEEEHSVVLCVSEEHGSSSSSSSKMSDAGSSADVAPTVQCEEAKSCTGEQSDAIVGGSCDTKPNATPGDTDVIEISDDDTDRNAIFIDCPDRMDREVEAFKKRLCIGDAPVSPPVAVEGGPITESESGSGDDVIFVGQVESELNEVDKWGKEMAALEERREHIERRVIDIDRQVANLNTEREQVRDQLALVNMQLSAGRKREGKVKVEG